jgi:tetratricopeptide (TPR) repeat protein
MVPSRTLLAVLAVSFTVTTLPAQRPKEADAAYNEGVRHVNAREYKKALQPLEKALSLAPDDAYRTKVYRALVPAYRTLADGEKMAEAGDFILRHSEQLTERRTAASSLSSFYFQRGLIDAQVKRYLGLYEKDKDDYAATAMLNEMSRAARAEKATAETYKKRHEEAERKLAARLAAAQEKLAEKDKTQTAWLWKEAAVLWVVAGDRPKALAASAKAEAAGPEKRNLLEHFWHAQLGDVYADAGKYAEAAKHFEKAIAATTIKGYQDTCRKKLEDARKKMTEKF